MATENKAVTGEEKSYDRFKNILEVELGSVGAQWGWGEG